MSVIRQQSPPSPAVTVDGVILCRCEPAEQGRTHWRVLLVRRRNEPYRDGWAFPGGFVDMGEDLPDAVVREVREETGLSGLDFRQFAAYGDPARDPRGHTVSIVFVAEVSGPPPPVVGGDDAAEARWHSLDALPELAFDHRRILDDLMVTRRLTL